MKRFIQKITGIYNDPNTSIEEDNKKTLSLLLYVTNVLGLIALIVFIIQYQSFGIPLSTFFSVILFLPFVIALIFKDKMGMRPTSFLATGAGYLIGSYTMLYEGYFSVSLALYIAVVVIAVFILGFREAMWTLGLILLTITAAGYLYTNEILNIKPQVLYSFKSPNSWATLFFAMMFFGVNLSFMLHRFHRKLIQSLKLAENKSIEVSQSNEELSRIKANLELLVKKRTSEIEEKNKKLQISNEELKKLNEELERFNTLFVGREFRIKELRDKIKSLENVIKEKPGPEFPDIE
ncbi:MAG: hypothetical protein KDC09_00165 [Bacteroidales bacterium]|nr:hypothetical protein [Bacteroidales bacterium]